MRRVALIVGVSRYDRDASIRQLQYVDADCTEFHGLLKHECGYDQVRTLRDPAKREVLDGVEELGAALGAGDLFLFYFAGHGVEFDGKHLLLCRPAKLAWLKHFDEVVPVDQLRDITARPGVERVFILDSCRGDLTLTRAAVGDGLRGERSLRDIAARKPAAQSPEGPLTILCSCSEGRQALELPDRKQGLFTAALLDVMQEAIGQGREVRLSDDFQDILARRMTDLANQHGQTWDQRPWVQRCGPAPLLLPGKPQSGVVTPSTKVETPPTLVPAPSPPTPPPTLPPTFPKDQAAAPVSPAPVTPPPRLAIPPVVAPPPIMAPSFAPARPGAAPPKLPAGPAATHLPSEILAFRAHAMARQLQRILSRAQTGRLHIGSTSAGIPPADGAAWMHRNLAGMVALSDWHQVCHGGDLGRELTIYGDHAAPWLNQIDRRFMDVGQARADTRGGSAHDRPARRFLNLMCNWALVVRDLDKARGYFKQAQGAASNALDWGLAARAAVQVFGDLKLGRDLWQKAVACATPDWLGLLGAVGLDLGASPDQARDTLLCGEQAVHGVSDFSGLANYWLDLLGDVESAERCARKAIALALGATLARAALDGIHLQATARCLADAGRVRAAEEVLAAMSALPDGDVDPTFIKVELAVDWAHLLGRQDKAREVMLKTEQVVLRMDQTALKSLSWSEWLRLAEGWSVLRDAQWSRNALQQAALRCVKLESRRKAEAAAQRLFPGLKLAFPAPK